MLAAGSAASGAACGAAAAGFGFGAAAFLAAGGAWAWLAATVGGAAGAGASWVGGFGAAERVEAVGSGFMMLTGGVLAELGNSAVVGLPAGADGANPAKVPAGGCR